MTFQTPAPSQGEPASQPSDGQPAPEGQQPQDAGTPPTPVTVEDIEKQWQHRVSQKDKAHAAAEQALRDENDALKRQLATLSQPRSQSSGQSGTQTPAAGSPEADVLREQLSAERKAREDVERRAAIEQRRGKYPSLARNVGEAGIDIFTTADEATLAKLNAQLDDGSTGTGTFAPTSPRRAAPSPSKTLGDMNKAELEAQLRAAVERGDLKRD